MAIEGPLRELALTDVLQLVHLSRKTGRLSVQASRHATPALLLFDRGAVVGAQSPGDSARLGRLLQLAGKATGAQVERALAAQRATPSRRLGAILVESEQIPASEVERQLRFQVEETLFDLLRWTDGYFRFEEATPPDPGPIRIRVGTEALLLEGLRRADEWSELASGATDASLIPRLVEGSATGATLQLLPSEWEVLAAIDGRRSLRAVAREVGRAEFDVAKAVFALASARVVELGRPTPQPTAEDGVVAALAGVQRQLRAGRLDDAEQSLAELERRMPARAELRLARGQLEARRGRWAAAAEVLAEATRLDPLLAEAYYFLGLALARTGDLSGAQSALATCGRLAPEHAEGRAGRAAALLAELCSLLEETQ